MKSVRFSPELQRRLSATAERLALTESEVIRLALDDFCDEASDEASPADRVLELMRQWEREDEGSPSINVASRAHELWGDYVYEKHRKTHGQQLKVAEQSAEYKPASAD